MTAGDNSSPLHTTEAYFYTSAGHHLPLPKQDLEILQPDTLETHYFSVTLPDSVDPSPLARRIAGSARWWKEFDLVVELDKLYEEVLETTQLYKPMPEKIKISFRENFCFSRGSSLKPASTVAAYFHEEGMICVRVKRANREVLAHEMAHAALHHYTGMRLSRNVDEAVAMWTAGQLTQNRSSISNF